MQSERGTHPIAAAAKNVDVPATANYTATGVQGDTSTLRLFTSAVAIGRPDEATGAVCRANCAYGEVVTLDRGGLPPAAAFGVAPSRGDAL